MIFSSCLQIRNKGNYELVWGAGVIRLVHANRDPSVVRNALKLRHLAQFGNDFRSWFIQIKKDDTAL